jgi:hypothetical protein
MRLGTAGNRPGFLSVRIVISPTSLLYRAQLKAPRGWLAFFALALAAIAHALPALLNSQEVHSDAAVVGLQARHFLHGGEWSWFLWGSGYQTATDSVLAALCFLALGATPLALTLSAFMDHLLLVAFAFATVRRRFGPWPSALLVSPLVLATGPLHTYMFSPPRQASLTLVFAAIWLLDGAPSGKRPALALATGSFVAGLACFADPYALLFMPAVAVLVLLGSAEARGVQRAWSAACGAAGALCGLAPWWLLSHSQLASPSVLKLRSDLVVHNLRLLYEPCLPYLLATTVYFSPHAPGVTVWSAPGWFRLIQLVGASALLLGMVFGGACIVVKRVPFSVRRLAVAGAVMLPVTLGAFALSVMVMDRFSARYLVAIVLMAPFALMPLLVWLGPARLGLLLAPYLLSAAVAGWLGYGADVDGFRVIAQTPGAADEVKLRAFLEQHSVSAAMADYWVAYRLTFLFDERIVVVPWHASLDRYPPYRAVVAAQDKVAYIYDPWRSNELLSKRQEDVQNGKTEFARALTSFGVGRYTVLLLQRPTEAAPHPQQMVSVSFAGSHGAALPQVSAHAN